MFKVKDGLNINGYTLTNVSGVLTFSSAISIAGTITQTSGNFVGSGSIQAASASDIFWLSRSRMSTQADGNIGLYNNAGTSFGLLQFGGVTSSFPALKRNSNILEVRLSDDSSYGNLNINNLNAYGGFVRFGTSNTDSMLKKTGTRVDFRLGDDTGYADGKLGTLYFGSGTRINDSADGTIVFANSGFTGFTSVQFGGTTASFPALNRNGTVLESKLADNSAYGTFAASQFQLAGSGTYSEPAVNRGILYYDTTGGDFTISARSNGGSSALSFRTSNAGTGTEWMRITSSGLFTFGGVSSSFPAFKRSGAQIVFRVADDTGYGGIRSSYNQFTNASVIQDSADGTIRLSNSTFTGFTMLQFGGTSASFPALKVSGANLVVRLADDTADSSIQANTIYSSAGAFLTTTKGGFSFPSDGIVTLLNNAQTAFSRLQFGGQTASFPAIKRNGTELDFRLADDSTWAPIGAGSITATGGNINTFFGLAGSGSAHAIFKPTDFATNKPGFYIENPASTKWQLGMWDGTSYTGTLALKSTSVLIDAKLNTTASTTSAASLNIPHGTAPTSPTNGDMWTTTGGLAVQINGSTQVLGAVSADSVELWFND